MKRRDYDPETILLLEMLTRWRIIELGVVLALEQVALGKITSLVAGLGIASFTIGFALQDLAKNLVDGVLLLDVPDLLKDPAPAVIFSTFGDSAIEFSAYY